MADMKKRSHMLCPKCSCRETSNIMIFENGRYRCPICKYEMRNSEL